MSSNREKNKTRRAIVNSNEFCKIEIYAGAEFDEAYGNFKVVGNVKENEVAKAIVAMNKIQKKLFEKSPNLIEIVKEMEG